jgi:hypothetical protein
MSNCNYCTMRRIVMEARMKGQAITKIPWNGGVDVYVHPRTVVVKSREAGRSYWKAWFMKLTHECSC